MTTERFKQQAQASAKIKHAYGVELLRAVAAGLGAVHALKLVHRDVKPSNIVIETDTGRPVLIDFGLAQRRSASNLRISITSRGPLFAGQGQLRDHGRASEARSAAASGR